MSIDRKKKLMLRKRGETQKQSCFFFPLPQALSISLRTPHRFVCCFFLVAKRLCKVTDLVHHTLTIRRIMQKVFIHSDTAHSALLQRPQPSFCLLDQGGLVRRRDCGFFRSVAKVQAVHTRLRCAGKIHVAVDRRGILGQEFEKIVVECPFHVGDLPLLVLHRSEGMTVAVPAALEDNDRSSRGLRVCNRLLHRLNAGQHAVRLERERVTLKVRVVVLEQVVLAPNVLPAVDGLLHDDPRRLTHLNHLQEAALTGANRRFDRHNDWLVVVVRTLCVVAVADVDLLVGQIRAEGALHVFFWEDVAFCGGCRVLGEEFPLF